MSKTVVSLFSKLFGIREGEIQRVLLMQLNIFLIITTLLIIKPTVNGLFLAEVGVKQLPVVFIMIAVLAVLLSKVYNRLLGRISFQHILIGTLGLSVLLLLFFGWVLQSSFRGLWVYYAFYVWSTVFGVLAASQFWIFASMLFNIREAKRLFGFISVGAISGGIFGGYLTILLTDIIGSEQQVFVAAALLSLCLPITYFIWQRNISGIHSKFQRRKQINKAERPLNLIRQSPHLSYLAGIIGVSVIAAKLVDYQFSAIAADRISDPDELTAFFGFWFSTFNLLSLAIQLLLTRRVVGTFGIGTSLLFQPAAILLGAILLFIVPGLGFAIFIKMGDSSLKQSINKAAFELLSLPIPARIKNQTKTYIDVVIDSIATGIGGLILIFVINGLQLSTTYVSLIIIVLVVIWIWLIWKVRQSYLRSFRNQLLNPSAEATSDLDLSHQSIVENLQTVLEKGTESEILATLQKLIQTPDQRLAAAIFKVLKHPSVSVKEASLQALYFVPQPHFLKTIEKLVYHPQQNIKIAAFDYLIAQNTLDATELFSKFLQKDQPKIQLAALVSMARESRNNQFLKKQLQLEQIVEDTLQTVDIKNPDSEAQFVIIGLLKAIGWGRLELHYSLIQQQFNAPVLNLRRQAILAAGQTLEPVFIPKLVEFLAEKEEQVVAQQALLNYGPAIINDLKNVVQQQPVNTTLLSAIPAIAEPIGTQASVDLLFDLVHQNNWEVRLMALYALQQSKIRFPHLRFKEKSISNLILKEAQLYQDTLSILYVQQKNAPGPEMVDLASMQLQQQRRTLIGLLEKRLDANLKRIFHLLGLKYPPDDIESIYQHLRSKQEDMRTNALEYLDNLLDPSLKTIIIPIVETAMLDSISEKVIRSLKWRIPAEQECYRLLMVREDPPLRQAVEKLQQLQAAAK